MELKKIAEALLNFDTVVNVAIETLLINTYDSFAPNFFFTAKLICKSSEMEYVNYVKILALYVNYILTV